MSEEYGEVTSYEQLPGTAVTTQVKTNYTTAMTVQKPRSMNTVLAKCLEESALAGENFYYSWEVGGKTVEGGTIGLAQCLFRNYGNDVIDMHIDERPDAWFFKPTFIDLENGSSINCVFRQNRTSPKTKYGKDIYSADRAQDILFSLGQSKAVRNIIFRAVPEWIKLEMISKAKEHVMSKIEKMGEVAARQMVVDKLAENKIPLELVESVYGPHKGWTKIKLVQLSGAIKAVVNGEASVSDVFPQPEPTASENLAQKATESLKETAKKSAQKEPTKAEDVPLPPEPVVSAPEKVADKKEPFNLADLGSPVIPAKVDPVIELGLEPVDEKPKLTGAIKALTEMVSKAKTPAMRKAAEDKIKMVLNTGNITEKQSQELLKQLVTEG